MQEIVAADFFVVPTVRNQVLFVFLLLAHERRRVVHFNVTAHPTSQWAAQQIVEAFPWTGTTEVSAPRPRPELWCGLSEPDRRHGYGEILTAARSPWQNPCVDRLIGSIRRECLDQVIVVNERHLKRVLESYFRYYHRWRTHLGLEMDCPEPRDIQGAACGQVVEVPEMGGLHHHYERVAA